LELGLKQANYLACEGARKAESYVCSGEPWLAIKFKHIRKGEYGELRLREISVRKFTRDRFPPASFRLEKYALIRVFFYLF